MGNNKTKGSTHRTQNLHGQLIKKGFTNRRDEWLFPEDFEDIGKKKNIDDISLIERRAMALSIMLESMVKEKHPEKTQLYKIKKGELIVGNIPMGSLGFGKTFPNYLTDEEKEVAFFSSRDVESVLGHNAPDYSKLLKMGLKGILETCKTKKQELETIDDNNITNAQYHRKKRRREFYNAVEISCNAVIKYANSFADLAEKEAEKAAGKEKEELLKVARICRKVPYNPAENFHEALQSIYFLHLTFHASTSHVSFGRLDQVLEPYFLMSQSNNEISKPEAQELIECFLIKCAERLTLTMEYIQEQDFAEFATGMGHSPFLVDQEATINQFMQNIVIGGHTRKGLDATNNCTFLILDACGSVGLPTPIVNLRIHKDSPEALLKKAAESSLNGNNGQPIIYNDDVIIPALSSNSKIPKEEANDYIVDGCWEVLLNGKCDFTYNMVNLLTVMECSLNQGALLSPGTAQIRGTKKSFLSTNSKEIRDFDHFREIFLKHLNLFVKKAGMEVYSFYSLEGSVTPVPLFSSLLGTCLEKGIDKTWGGADYNIGGVVYIAMPNVANAFASIKLWVFEKKKYTFDEVVAALRSNFEGSKRREEMRKDFLSTPKFGNNDPYVDLQMQWLVDNAHRVLVEAEELSDKIYLTEPKTEEERIKIERLRLMAEYEGESMKERYGKDFNMMFSAGSGTFAQYALFGSGCAASADGRLSGEPVAPNFSPSSGTAIHGEGAVLSSLEKLNLNKYAAGVIVDICLDKNEMSEAKMVEVYKKFLRSNGSIVSLTVAGYETLQKAHETCNEVRNKTKSQEALNEFADLNVRVGGWNGPFITLTQIQQEDYMKRVHKSLVVAV